MTSSAPQYVLAPRLGANDDRVRLLEWRVADGARVSAGEVIAIVETSKASFDVHSDHSGYLFHSCQVDSFVQVGSPLAAISTTPERPGEKPAVTEQEAPNKEEGPLITPKAMELIRANQLSIDQFAHLSVVRTSDVEAILQSKRARPRYFGDELLDPNQAWDEVLQSDDYRRLNELLTALRKRMKGRFERHVPTGDLLHDRWRLARDHRFGEGSSAYDDCLILGDVRVGRDCWIGPFTVLDGAHAPLTIGDHSSIGAGSQLYTHDTIERVLTGSREGAFHQESRVGACCFVSPLVMIGPGTTIGDHSFVAAGSFVQGDFPAFSWLAGSPARRVGRVEIEGRRARLRRDE